MNYKFSYMRMCANRCYMNKHKYCTIGKPIVGT